MVCRMEVVKMVQRLPLTTSLTRKFLAETPFATCTLDGHLYNNMLHHALHSCIYMH